MAQRPDGRRHHFGCLLHRNKFVVPRIAVGVGDARTRQIVVELVPQHPLPDLVQLLAVVCPRTQPVGRNRSPFGRAQQFFVATVVILHRRLRRIASRRMFIHQQFAVIRRQFVAAVHIILEKLVARGADDLDRSVRIGHCRRHAARRRHGSAVAPVTAVGCAVQMSAAVIPHGRIVETVRGTTDEILVVARIGRKLRRVTARIECRHKRLAVDTVPYAPREGIFLVIGRIGIELALAPAQFLCREPDQTAMGGQRRQRITEPEAVGEKNIRRTDSELPFIELLPLQDVADE